MAVTYADLVAFGFAYVEDSVTSSLKNQKNSVKTSTAPLLSSGAECLCTQEDFIVLAEFSEVKGPVALLTVPSYVQHVDAIDINTFIMRIMSVDYQANPGGEFCICQDTQVLQTFVSPDRHAYVHYFTLYDLHARGFVRPLCLAYVSSDHRKLHRIFPQLREHFLKTTEMMKIDNRRRFASELSSVLVAIEKLENDNPTFLEGQGVYDSFNMKTFHSNAHAEQMRQQHAEYSHMFKTVEASLVNTDFISSTLEHWKCAFTLPDDVPVAAELQHYVDLVSARSATSSTAIHLRDGGCVLDKQLRPVPSLSPWGTASALWRLIDGIKMFGHCELSSSLGGFPALSYPQCGIEEADRVDRDVDCAWDALSQSEFLQLLLAMSIGSQDASTSTPDETDNDQPDSSKECTSGNEGSSSYHSLSDSDNLTATSHKQKQDALIDLQSTNLSEHLSSCNKNSYSVTSLLDSYRTVDDDSVSLPAAQEIGSYLSVVDSCSTPIHSIRENVEEISSQPMSNAKIVSLMTNGATKHQEESDKDSDDSESFHDILEVLHSDDNWSLGSNNEELAPCSSWSHCVWTRFRPVSKSGHRLLKFFWTYRSTAQHVIFSLLTGRTLVLVGDATSERRISRIMNALSPLIPPLDSNGLRVLRWHRGILVSAHIASYQVIGMCVPERLSFHDMISPRDKNCVTILDVNTDQLLGPAYHGHLLAPIGNNVRDFSSDHSLLLFMNSVFTGVGHKLQAYKALVAACNNELPSHACRLLDLRGCDADIIRYLSKLVL